MLSSCYFSCFENNFRQCELTHCFLHVVQWYSAVTLKVIVSIVFYHVIERAVSMLINLEEVMVSINLFVRFTLTVAATCVA